MTGATADPVPSEVPRPRALSAIAASLAINGGMLGAVLLLAWDAREVLLLYWCEVAVLVLLGPFAAGLRSGAGAAREAAIALPFPMIFLAFHAFFLCGLLFGADWERAEGGPGGWSAPAIGEPPDWFAAALQTLPPLGLALLVAVQVGHLLWDHYVAELPAGASGGGFGGVILMHFLIIFGGSAILASGGAIGMLVLLVALKTFVEIAGAIASLRAS